MFGNIPTPFRIFAVLAVFVMTSHIAQGQDLSFGIKGGLVVTDDKEQVSGGSSESRMFTFGPSVEAPLPLENLVFEATLLRGGRKPFSAMVYGRHRGRRNGCSISHRDRNGQGGVIRQDSRCGQFCSVHGGGCGRRHVVPPRHCTAGNRYRGCCLHPVFSISARTGRSSENKVLMTARMYWN